MLICPLFWATCFTCPGITPITSWWMSWNCFARSNPGSWWAITTNTKPASPGMSLWPSSRPPGSSSCWPRPAPWGRSASVADRCSSAPARIGPRCPPGLTARIVDFVIWVTHHDLKFPDYEAGRVALREIPGLDLVVNGHIHTPKPPQQCGRTLWVNPGSISRVSRSIYTQKMQPAATLWRPGLSVPESIPIPHRPFVEDLSALHG